eukprot:2021919-Rhodomonas_salina.1
MAGSHTSTEGREPLRDSRRPPGDWREKEKRKAGDGGSSGPPRSPVTLQRGRTSLVLCGSSCRWLACLLALALQPVPCSPFGCCIPSMLKPSTPSTLALAPLHALSQLRARSAAPQSRAWLPAQLKDRRPGRAEVFQMSAEKGGSEEQRTRGKRGHARGGGGGGGGGGEGKEGGKAK